MTQSSHRNEKIRLVLDSVALSVSWLLFYSVWTYDSTGLGLFPDKSACYHGLGSLEWLLGLTCHLFVTFGVAFRFRYRALSGPLRIGITFVTGYWLATLLCILNAINFSIQKTSGEIISVPK